MVILALYCLAGMIRLAYYNVLEEKKNNDDDDAEVIEQTGWKKVSMECRSPPNISGASYNIYYVTFVGSSFPILLHGIMILAMILFITDFRFPKPTTKGTYGDNCHCSCRSLAYDKIHGQTSYHNYSLFYIPSIISVWKMEKI